jgi:hypothetical protein
MMPRAFGSLGRRGFAPMVRRFLLVLFGLGYASIPGVAETLPMREWYCQERATHGDSLPMRGVVLLRARVVDGALAADYPHCPDAKPVSPEVRPFLRLDVGSRHSVGDSSSWTGIPAFRLMESLRDLLVELKDEPVEAELEALIDLSCCGPNGLICIVVEGAEKPWGGLVTMLEIKGISLRKQRR